MVEKIKQGQPKIEKAGVRTPAKKSRFCKHRKYTYTF